MNTITCKELSDILQNIIDKYDACDWHINSNKYYIGDLCVIDPTGLDKDKYILLVSRKISYAPISLNKFKHELDGIKEDLPIYLMNQTPIKNASILKYLEVQVSDFLPFNHTPELFLGETSTPKFIHNDNVIFEILYKINQQPDYQVEELYNKKNLIKTCFAENKCNQKRNITIFEHDNDDPYCTGQLISEVKYSETGEGGEYKIISYEVFVDDKIQIYPSSHFDLKKSIIENI